MTKDEKQKELIALHIKSNRYYEEHGFDIKNSNSGYYYILKLLYKALKNSAQAQSRATSIIQCHELDYTCGCIVEAICNLIDERNKEDQE